MMVYPSGAASVTYCPAMLPLAPGRFSTMTGWPMFCESLAATRRVTPSAPPPGGNPTTQVIGLAGYACCARRGSGKPRVAAAINKSLRFIYALKHYARVAQVLIAVDQVHLPHLDYV